MKDCVNSELKGTVLNENLPLVGYYKAYVDTTNATANVLLSLLGDPTGVEIVGEGTFTDGTTKITSSEQLKYVAPNNQLTLIIPKYSCIPNPGTKYIVSSNQYHSVFAFDMDDLQYSSVISHTSTEILFGLNDNSLKGNLAYLVKCCPNLSKIYKKHNPSIADVTGNIQEVCSLIENTGITEISINGSKIQGNIENALTTFAALTLVYFQDTDVEGDESVCIRNMIQANKAAFKARTDYMTFAAQNSKCTNSWMSVSTHRYQFSGGSTVTVQNYNGSKTLGTYDIDTDTFTPAS